MKNVFVAILAIAALAWMGCNRNNGGNTTANNGGYGYQQPKSTDPNAFDAKPNDPPPPPPPDTVVVRDTMIIVVETPPVVPPTPPVQPPVNPVVPQNDPFAQPEPWMRPVPGAYIAIKIRRTPCYGTCPTYTAAIYSDGTVFIHGERFVPQVGYFEGRISQEQLNGLIKMSYQNGFYNLAANYPIEGNHIVDLPTTILHINSGVNQKTITDRGNAPGELDVLQDAVHTLLYSLQLKPLKN